MYALVTTGTGDEFDSLTLYSTPEIAMQAADEEVGTFSFWIEADWTRRLDGTWCLRKFKGGQYDIFEIEVIR